MARASSGTTWIFSFASSTCLKALAKEFRGLLIFPRWTFTLTKRINVGLERKNPPDLHSDCTEAVLHEPQRLPNLPPPPRHPHRRRRDRHQGPAAGRNA